MGYTHYWTHRRRFTNAEWDEVMTDLNRIAAQARAEGVELADWVGEKELSAYGSGEPRRFLPDFRTENGPVVYLNGLGDDSHETFCIYQNRRPDDGIGRRGWDFCKTARKPYDVVVTAMLCYLETCWDHRFEVSSDGDVKDWVAGLGLARRALPTKTNMLDIPFDILWEGQFTGGGIYGRNYSLRQRLDGELVVVKGYDVLARVPEFMVDPIREKIPCSGYIGEIEKKTDLVLRNLLTQPEVTIA